MRAWMAAIAVTLPVALMLSAAPLLARRQGGKPETEAERAVVLVVRWKQVIYPAFEDARASIEEEESDHVNALLSQGAVRAVRDRVDAPGLKTIDAAIARLATAILEAASRQPSGSLIIDEAALEKGLAAACPL